MLYYNLSLSIFMGLVNLDRVLKKKKKDCQSNVNLLPYELS